MENVAGVTKQIRVMRAKQRRHVGQGSEELARAREHQRKNADAMKKPRDRHLNKARLVSALKEMSKDLARLEGRLKRMEDRDHEISELLDKRRDLLLRDCFELSRVVKSRDMFVDLNRTRSLAEPIGGHTLASVLPSWIPSK